MFEDVVSYYDLEAQVHEHPLPYNIRDMLGDLMYAYVAKWGAMRADGVSINVEKESSHVWSDLQEVYITIRTEDADFPDIGAIVECVEVFQEQRQTSSGVDWVATLRAHAAREVAVVSKMLFIRHTHACVHAWRDWRLHACLRTCAKASTRAHAHV